MGMEEGNLEEVEHHKEGYEYGARMVNGDMVNRNVVLHVSHMLA